jgi:hypothetical protein
MNMKSMIKLDRAICLSILSVAAITTASQAEKAAAADLNFANLKFDTPNPINSSPNTTIDGDPAFTGTTIEYFNVAPGVDARITATPFGDNYSFAGHFPDYSTLTMGEPKGDTALQYQIANDQTGPGGLTYKIDLFESGGTFTTAFIAPELRFLIYDVDGESSQGEAVRIANGGGFVGYQVGNTNEALTPTFDALTNSYLFSGRNTNVSETDPSGAAIFYFQNTNSVTFQFEANTRTQSSINSVFSAIDGDLSLIQGNTSGFASRVDVSAAVPEPFTVIGTLVGGTAALRLRKKLKAAKAAE